MHLFIMLVLSLFLYDCAGTLHEGRTERTGGYLILDITKGLPQDGLWRQNIELFDMDKDGLLDIIAPPPRKADKDRRRPFVFLQTGGGWIEGRYRFPEIEDYDYGAVAVGDVNNDGWPDIALASHNKRILLLLNDGKGGFTEADFPSGDFKSRTAGFADLNHDGYVDLVALSEFPSPDQKEKGRTSRTQGILIGLNKQGKGWDINVMKEGSQFFGDSLFLGDINGDGNLDIAVAPMTAVKGDKKMIWIGDGRGSFRHLPADLAGDRIPTDVRTGDIDGDGRDEVVLKLSGMGQDAVITISVSKFTGEMWIDLTSDLKLEAAPVKFDLADIDSDGRAELIILSTGGLHVYKYTGMGWAEIVSYSIPSADTEGAHDIRAGRQADGSWLIVYNLGSEASGNRGIRAFLLRHE